MEKQRPNPETLLSKVQEEERLQEKEEKGKLKIFFGAAPGVGKTYAMLSEAVAKRAEGLDVVIGYVETHGRKETQALLEGLEILPRSTLEYRGRLLHEFDIDGAIKRHPALIVVDEMAHSNAVGMRHAKRWQDIKELLDRGIDVYTTLNIQHVESLNDVIKKITGVAVREMVPDSILDLADSVELIDLPPEDLLERLEEGKVYVAEQAELAIQHFFRKSNLIALRELSLRFTAERVNAQMQIQHRILSPEKSWSLREKLLVCVSHKPFSSKLIRSTRRLAMSLHCEWLAIYIDTGNTHLTEKQRQNAIQHLRAAEQLGAKTSIISGVDIVKEIMKFAQAQNVTKIVMGKEIRPKWKEILFKNLTNELIRASQDIDIYVISGEKSEFKSEPISSEPLTITSKKASWSTYLLSFVVVGVCTLINIILNTLFGQANHIAVYILGIMLVATRGFRGPSLLASLLSVVAYDYFFVPPHHTIALLDTQYIMTIVIMLLISQIISQLTIYVKRQNEIIRANAYRASTLHQLTTDLATKRGTHDLLRAGVKHISDVFESKVMALLPDTSGYLVEQISSNEIHELNAKERSIAQWAYDLGQMTGIGTSTLPFTNALYIPLQGTSGKIGVLRVAPLHTENLTVPEQLHLLETIVHQVVLAVEVDKLQEEARKDELKFEAEGLRNMLLIMTTHEIQLPLNTIQRTLSRLIKGLNTYDVQDIKAFVEIIHKDSAQLNHIAGELIQALKLEAGMVKIVKQPHFLEKVTRASVANVKKQFTNKVINISLPTDLPMILCDFDLIVQVIETLLIHLINNTTKEVPLTISALQKKSYIEVDLEDVGALLPIKHIESIFENYYTQPVSTKISQSGLALFICKSIIYLHGGKIAIEEIAEGGARYKLLLPIG